jgi:hypothetical protein
MGRRRREQEASQSKQTLSSLFAAVPKPPLCAPPIGLNGSGSHRRLVDSVSVKSQRNANDFSSIQSSRNKPQSPNEQDGEIIRALRKNSNPFLRNSLSHMRLDNDSTRTASQSRSSLRLKEGSKTRHSTSRFSHSSSEITVPVSNRRENKTSGGGMDTFLDDLKREYQGKRHSGPPTPVTTIYRIYEEEFDEDDWRPPHPPEDPIEYRYHLTGTPQPTSGHRKAVSGSKKVSRKEDQAHLSPHGIDSPMTPRGSRRRGRIQERASSNSPIHCKSPKSSKSSSSRHPDGKRRSSRSSSSGRSRQQSSRSSRSRSSFRKSSSSGSSKTPPSGSRPSTPSKRRRQLQEASQSASPRPKTPSRTSRQQRTTSPRRSRSNSTNRDRETQDLSPLRRPKTPSLRTRRSLQSPVSQSQTPSTRSNHSRTIAPPIFSPAFSTDNNTAPAIKRDRPQREFAAAIDWKGLSPRIHGNVCVVENVIEQELKKPNQNCRQSLDSGSSDETPPDHPILNQVRRWNQQYVENNDNASHVHQMEKFDESFSSRASRSVHSARLLASLYDEEKNEEYLEQAKERHQARRHSFNSVEDSCLFYEDVSLPLPQQEDVVETTTEQEPAGTNESRIRKSIDETPKGMPILNDIRKWREQHIERGGRKFKSSSKPKVPRILFVSSKP